jgi:hypothetical protein
MGLYDDENAAVTAGDLADVIYWQTKFAHLKLEAAVRTRQPERAVGALVAEVTAGAADLLRTFPNHREVAAWRDRALAVAERIDPTAAPANLRPDFGHWTDYAYESGWRSYHMAKSAVAVGDARVALAHAREAVAQLTWAEGRMADWPVDIRQFVKLARPEMAKLVQQVRPPRSA